VPIAIQGGAEGLLFGATLAAIAVGFTLTFGVLDLANFAHGDFVTIGMYFAWWSFVHFHVNPLLAALLVIPLGFVFGTALFFSGIERVQRSSRILQMVLTLGVLMIVENSLLLVFSGNYQVVYLPIASQHFRLIGLGLGVADVVNALLALGAVGVIWLFLHRTAFGRVIRACAQSDLGTRLVQLPVRRAQIVALSLSLSLAMFAGCLLIQVQPVAPFVGLDFTLIAFLVAVVGGLGDIPGAVVGSLFYGLISGVLSALMNPSVAAIVALGTLIFVLAIAPEGLTSLLRFARTRVVR
jgi:branched-chain amino acid transport system permease protein